MADDGPYKEAVICDLGALFHTGSSQVQVHLMVGTGDGRQCKVTHAVELQLESQGRFQVPVDTVLLKLEKKDSQNSQKLLSDNISFWPNDYKMNLVENGSKKYLYYIIYLGLYVSQ